MLAVLCGALMLASGHAEDKLSAYMYEDTKRLVTLVEDAAGLVEQQGTAVFPPGWRHVAILVPRVIAADLHHLLHLRGAEVLR
ncbi:MAG: hypothetical protein A3K19_22165 [Lentisphaerae bacterium RIFOXYB12_FULL_65_16]|nr:MAG: hypothetical protein A3K18_21405 [Lentisphaerae bacterium RIFOXYA12_64_32]OGV93567.1 MAG: hypothetical protein A3K19_22165 [Lentisphaerae bacterium RIFOXYB12_FULL_65_16]